MSKALADPIARRARVDHHLDRLAWVMDRAIRVPGTNIHLGLDALLGLLPIGGDVATGLVQAGLVLVALKHYKVPKAVAKKMVANVLLDMGVGAIPILGDLFDVAFKANTRNLKLLEPYRHHDQDEGAASFLPGIPAPPVSIGMPWKFLAVIAAVLLGMLTLVVIGFVVVIRWLIS